MNNYLLSIIMCVHVGGAYSAVVEIAKVYQPQSLKDRCVATITLHQEVYRDIKRDKKHIRYPLDLHNLIIECEKKEISFLEGVGSAQEKLLTLCYAVSWQDMLRRNIAWYGKEILKEYQSDKDYPLLSRAKVNSLLAPVSKQAHKQLLHEAGAEMLCAAAQRGYAKWLLYFLGRGIPPDICQDVGDSTALIEAIKARRLICAQILLNVGANQNYATGDEKKTPLIIVAQESLGARWWDMLVGAGADPTLLDAQGHSPEFYNRKLPLYIGATYGA